MAKVGRQVHYRPPHYSSKTSSVNGVIGKRNGHWFQCTSGAKINSDFNAAKNLALWDYRSCPVDFQKPQRGSPQSLAKQDDGRTQSVPVFAALRADRRQAAGTLLAFAEDDGAYAPFSAVL